MIVLLILFFQKYSHKMHVVLFNCCTGKENTKLSTSILLSFI